jgi:hypothetical protein
MDALVPLIFSPLPKNPLFFFPMSFQEFLRNAWKEHAHDSAAVSARMRQGLNLLEKSEDIAPMARLIVHVEGEHLGQWSQGMALLGELRSSPHFSGAEADSALRCGEATLLVCESGSLASVDLNPSERLKALAMAVGAVSAQGSGERAESIFREALGIAVKLKREDPACKDLAMASNNLAVALEEKAEKAFRDIELMLMAAHAARRFWEISGTWLEVERAEYRLAMSFLSAGRPWDALRHAENCYDLCLAHSAPPFELFYGQEALALSFAAAGDWEGFRHARWRALDLFARLPEEEKPWCKDSHSRLEGMESTKT